MALDQKLQFFHFTALVEKKKRLNKDFFFF